MKSSEPVGLIAGWGRFPVLFAQKAQEVGIPVICVGVRGMADRNALLPFIEKFYWSRVASMSRPINCFKREGVKRWTFAGKVNKTMMFKPWRLFTLFPDWRMIRFWLSRRKDNSDDTITLGIIKEFEKEGLHCESALQLCPELLVKSGILTKRQPSRNEEQDIEIGWHLAKEMGRLDIGQSVIIREKAVLAVEAIEGTDRAILRAGELCQRQGFVVVKVAKPQQDMRFDVPAVGVSTIETMYQSGGKVLAIEAGKTILLDESATIDLANRYGISIIAR
jgi:UDP-2,3-diacylglucosamine hydrolase